MGISRLASPRMWKANIMVTKAACILVYTIFDLIYSDLESWQILIDFTVGLVLWNFLLTTGWYSYDRVFALVAGITASFSVIASIPYIIHLCHLPVTCALRFNIETRSMDDGCRDIVHILDETIYEIMVIYSLELLSFISVVTLCISIYERRNLKI
jgi:hypothetical protein